MFSVWYITDVNMSFIVNWISEIGCNNLISFMSLTLSSLSCGVFAVNLFFYKCSG